MSTRKDHPSAAPSNSKQLSKNTHELMRVERQLKKQNSVPNSFIRGMVTALGATVGVTLVLGVIVFIVDHIAKAFGVDSLTHDLLETLKK